MTGGHRPPHGGYGGDDEFCRAHDIITDGLGNVVSGINRVEAKVDKIDGKTDDLALASARSATERWWIKWSIYVVGSVFAAALGTMLTLMILYVGDTRSLITIVKVLQEADQESKEDRKALHRQIDQHQKEVSTQLLEMREKLGTFQTMR